jgi:hypothetical protein
MIDIYGGLPDVLSGMTDSLCAKILIACFIIKNGLHRERFLSSTVVEIGNESSCFDESGKWLGVSRLLLLVSSMAVAEKTNGLGCSWY